jgi:very-short-patch-repair endonuclease
MKFSDIGAVDSSSRGVRLLQQYLEYSESGIKSLLGSKITKGDTGAEEDSPFEVDVRMELEKRGLIVHKQVGVSGFKIDLAIVNPKNENEYILGIECDGATYHSSYSARVNDRLRQDVLENLGWKIYRIWSQHWITHRSEIIEDIIRNIELYKNTVKKEEVLAEERMEGFNVEPVEQVPGGYQDEIEVILPNNLIEIDSNQVIEILNISRGTFSIWMREKKLKPIRRIGRRWFFDKGAVEKLKENAIDNSVEIDSNQAIEILNISRGTFSIWMREKKLKPIRRIGNRWIFNKETIESLGRIE